MRRHLVAAIACDGLCTFEFGCVVELFALPRPELDIPWYEFAVCAPERKALQATGGITVQVPHSLRLLGRADTIIVPGWVDPHVLPRRPWCARVRALQRAYARGARLCSICSGVFVLAAAGKSSRIR